MNSIFDMSGGGAMSPWWMQGGGPLTYRPSLDWFMFGNQGQGGLMAPPDAPMAPPPAPQVPPVPMPPPAVPPTAGGGVLAPPGAPLSPPLLSPPMPSAPPPMAGPRPAAPPPPAFASRRLAEIRGGQGGNSGGRRGGGMSPADAGGFGGRGGIGVGY